MVYVHVPWCRRHCPYCDFAVAVQATIPHVAYGDAIEAEWRHRADEGQGARLRSIYLGGGTPGLWAPDQVARTLETIRQDARWVDQRAAAETTIELNPEALDPGALRALVEAGVDRVSLGVQSFDDDVLRQLGRAHTGSQARAAIEAVQAAGVRRLTLDLILGAPAATLETTRADVAHAVASQVPHLSAYELTWEPGTAFDLRRRRGTLVPKRDEDIELLLEVAANELRSAGFVRYEVSSWAQPGAEAVHNSGYWEGVPYTGLGVGAHSLVVGASGEVRRRANARAVREYLRAPLAGNWEVVRARTFAFELAMSALRTRRGWDVLAWSARTGVDATPLFSLLARWHSRGWGTWDGVRFGPSETGLWVSDSLSLDVLDVLGVDTVSGEGA